MKILIVDDSKFSQIMTAKLVRNLLADIDISYAKDGEEGFQKYQELHPDYVFIDLLMPNINGRTLIEMIKTYDKNAKIFVISADVQHHVRREIEGYGIKAFINKPFNQEKAESVVSIIKDDMQ